MDFKENFRIGGGPIETGQMFFQKTQVSVLGFAIYYKDEDGDLRLQHVNYLSEILSHDSLFVIDCLTKLFSDSFMSRFNDVCFWSDCGPHFRSAEILAFIYHQLPQLRQGQYFLNFFAEHHGKSVVDGHFGVLTNWFSAVEAVRNVRNIHDLVELFREKTVNRPNLNSKTPEYFFDIYDRFEPRGVTHKLTVKNLCSYLAFVRVGNKLFASTLSTLDYTKYTEVAFKVTAGIDKRETKRAPKRQSMDIDVPVVVGPNSKRMLLRRIRLARKYRMETGT